MEKNINVEVLRIFLTVTVCLHHFRLYSDTFPYGGGYIAVDCFFIISGYYMARHIMENKGGSMEGCLRYIYKRYSRLFPGYFLAFVFAFVFRVIAGEIPSGHLWGYMREAFMIEFWCVDSGKRINPPDWYCGYLLLASGIVYEYVKRMRRSRSLIYVTGIVAVGLYVILMLYSSNINIYPQYRCILSAAILRGIAGLLLGCWIYLLDKRIYGIISKQNRRISYIFAGSLSVGFAYILLWKNFLPYVDYFAIVLFILLFCLALNIKMNSSNACVKRTVEYVGKQSYSIYLNHYLIAFFFSKYMWFKGLDWKEMSLIYLVAVYVFSSGVFLLEKTVLMLYRRMRGKNEKN